MTTDISKVSLGFAEFVSQLLHETFDAVLSAQSYQLEKYLELEKALSMSNEQFKNCYISDEELEEREEEMFSMPLVEQMAVPEESETLIEQYEDEKHEKNLIWGGVLTEFGVLTLKSIVIDSLVTEKKEKLKELVNNSQMVRLMADSGEIKAKLELSSLYQSETPAQKEAPVVTKRMAQRMKREVLQNPLDAEMSTITTNSIAGIAIQEITDPKSQEKTILIDKESLKASNSFSQSIPQVRLVASPAQISSNSNLYSEVTIKFKTV